MSRFAELMEELKKAEEQKELLKHTHMCAKAKKIETELAEQNAWLLYEHAWKKVNDLEEELKTLHQSFDGGNNIPEMRKLRLNPEIQQKIHDMTERFRKAAQAGAKSTIRVR